MSEARQPLHEVNTYTIEENESFRDFDLGDFKRGSGG